MEDVIMNQSLTKQ